MSQAGIASLTATLSTIFNAGTGITITTAPGSITITNSAPGTTWTRVAGTSQAMQAFTGYIPTNAALTTFTLPVSAAVGDTFEVAGEGTGLYRIAQNGGQQIFFGVQSSTIGVGGHIDSTNQRDSIRLICTLANTNFTVVSSVSAAFLVT